MVILPKHIGLSCKVNVIRLESTSDIPLDPHFPFYIVGVSKNNRALVCLWNNRQTIFSVAGFNIIINKGEFRKKAT